MACLASLASPGQHGQAGCCPSTGKFHHEVRSGKENLEQECQPEQSLTFISAAQGLLVFLGGNALQNQSHWLLAGLARPTEHTSKGSDAYRVPHGEWQLLCW